MAATSRRPVAVLMLLRLSCKRLNSRSVCSFTAFSCSILIFSISDALAAAGLVATPFDEAMFVSVALYVFLVWSLLLIEVSCSLVWPGFVGWGLAVLYNYIKYTIRTTNVRCPYSSVVERQSCKLKVCSSILHGGILSFIFYFLII